MCGYAATLALLLAGYRVTIASVPGTRGVRRMTWTLVVAIAGILLLALRSFAPAWLTILMGNEAIFVSSLLAYRTAAEILAVPPRFLPWGIGTLAIAPAAMGYFTYFDSSLSARIVIVSILCALYAAATAFVLFRYRDALTDPDGVGPTLRVPTAALAWLQSMVAFLHLFRCVHSVLCPPRDLQHIGVMQVSFSYAYMMLSVATACGLMWLALCIQRSELQAMAQTDSLTGLLNRRGFEELLARELNRANHVGASVVLLLLDIDRFKAVNDTWGHQAGDEVLRLVSGTLQQGLRISDVLSRYGGEEFVILLRNADGGQALEIAERLRAEVASLTGLPGPAQITVSIGVAGSRPGEMPEELFRRCDEAMYRSKRAGRNLVTVSDFPPPQSQITPLPV